MLRIITRLMFCALITLPATSHKYEIRYFDQQVDHFGYHNNDHFLQRYLIADQYWNNSAGPIFFYTGNEGDITMFAENAGFMWELAPKFQALLVFGEHRYYGLTMPYGDHSFDGPENLGYLTSEQALADFATLIYNLKDSLSAKLSPVIAFGGSYGGMLAAWMRLKYPHIIHGSIASSAPILQFLNLTPCGKFAEIVTNDFAFNGDQCVKSIKKSWKLLRKYGGTKSGAEWLSSYFNLCSVMAINDIDKLVDWVAETWEYLAMLDYPYPTHFLLPLPSYPIKEACKYLKNATEPDKELLYHLFEALSVFHNYTGTVQCFNLSESSGKTLGDKGWDYQSCTEMVMPMCRTGITDMFEPQAWNFTAFSIACQKAWRVTPDPKKAIIMYGGRNISAASNIFFSNGKLDPWYAGGVLNSISKSLVAYQISSAAHHLDLRASNFADPKSVKKARNLETCWIEKWIKDATFN